MSYLHRVRLGRHIRRPRRPELAKTGLGRDILRDVEFFATVPNEPGIRVVDLAQVIPGLTFDTDNSSSDWSESHEGSWGRALSATGDATNDRISFTADALEDDFLADVPLTIAFRMLNFSGGNTGFRRVVERASGGSAAGGFSLFKRDGQTSLRAGGGGNGVFSQSSTGLMLLDDEWHNIVVVVPSTGIARFYIDGEFHGNQVQGNSDSPQNTATDGAIGNFADGTASSGKQLKGSVSEVITWRRDMTAAEAKAWSLPANRGLLFEPRTVWVPFITAVSGDLDVDASTASYAWTPLAATIERSLGVDASTASYAWTPLAATVTTNTDLEIDASTASYAWTPLDAGVLTDREVAANLATYAWTPLSASISFGLNVSATTAAYAWTPLSASVVTDREIEATLASYSWTALSATVETGSNLNISASLASYAWTTQAATLTTSREVLAGVAAYSWTALSATVQRGEEAPVASSGVSSGKRSRKRRRFILGGRLYEVNTLAEEEAIIAAYVEEKEAEVALLETEETKAPAPVKISLRKAKNKLAQVRQARRRRNDNQLITLLAAA